MRNQRTNKLFLLLFQRLPGGIYCPLLYNQKGALLEVKISSEKKACFREYIDLNNLEKLTCF